jgi:hypothetical protein
VVRSPPWLSKDDAQPAERRGDGVQRLEVHVHRTADPLHPLDRLKAQPGDLGQGGLLDPGQRSTGADLLARESDHSSPAEERYVNIPIERSV